MLAAYRSHPPPSRSRPPQAKLRYPSYFRVLCDAWFGAPAMSFAAKAGSEAARSSIRAFLTSVFETGERESHFVPTPKGIPESMK